MNTRDQERLSSSKNRPQTTNKSLNCVDVLTARREGENRKSVESVPFLLAETGVVIHAWREKGLGSWGWREADRATLLRRRWLTAWRSHARRPGTAHSHIPECSLPLTLVMGPLEDKTQDRKRPQSWNIWESTLGTS